jgi:hypothetical protein
MPPVMMFVCVALGQITQHSAALDSALAGYKKKLHEAEQVEVASVKAAVDVMHFKLAHNPGKARHSYAQEIQLQHKYELFAHSAAQMAAMQAMDKEMLAARDKKHNTAKADEVFEFAARAEVDEASHKAAANAVAKTVSILSTSLHRAEADSSVFKQDSITLEAARRISRLEQQNVQTAAAVVARVHDSLQSLPYLRTDIRKETASVAAALKDERAARARAQKTDGAFYTAKMGGAFETTTTTATHSTQWQRIWRSKVRAAATKAQSATDAEETAAERVQRKERALAQTQATKAMAEQAIAKAAVDIAGAPEENSASRASRKARQAQKVAEAQADHFAETAMTFSMRKNQYARFIPESHRKIVRGISKQ